jgi:hypothetical protein
MPRPMPSTPPPTAAPLPGRTRAELAAMNNAVWCDTVCRAHGVPGEFGDGLWRLRHVPPPYHSNLVTIAADDAAGAVMGHIHALLALPLGPRWSVKASHATLDLAPLGFEPLFDASWIWLDAPAEPAWPDHAESPTSAWSRIDGPAGLARWEHGWSGDGTDRTMEGRPRQFPPSLLADPDVVVLAAPPAADGRIVAGAIANRSGPVVGVSNNFGETLAWPALIAAARATFPGLSLVGYERGDALSAAVAAGFEAIGPLRVWIRGA